MTSSHSQGLEAVASHHPKHYMQQKGIYLFCILLSYTLVERKT